MRFSTVACVALLALCATAHVASADGGGGNILSGNTINQEAVAINKDLNAVVVNAGKNGKGVAEVNAANVISQNARIGRHLLNGGNGLHVRVGRPAKGGNILSGNTVSQDAIAINDNLNSVVVNAGKNGRGVAKVNAANVVSQDINVGRHLLDGGHGLRGRPAKGGNILSGNTINQEAVAINDNINAAVVNAGKNGRGVAKVNVANVISQDASIGRHLLDGGHGLRVGRPAKGGNILSGNTVSQDAIAINKDLNSVVVNAGKNGRGVAKVNAANVVSQDINVGRHLLDGGHGLRGRPAKGGNILSGNTINQEAVAINKDLNAVVVNAGKNGRGRAEVNAANVISQDASIGGNILSGNTINQEAVAINKDLNAVVVNAGKNGKGVAEVNAANVISQNARIGR
ncbi:hypothetical protein MNEG_0968 [Monoraphidium neglectum]|uniref:Right handed beta helix domain-containing protein n=1 Tax=Monoraphidium neglectum TaxID=145388 RepID=A0A0D2LKR4_9CHLO|nr:hypothetical protein MNEG_0968 [Monoraphidium neglectum]KIZ06989.1 hypothetical protein MNEG_0968 [Monoraphidium neglectum]|eukprot:XP_013906008.1 hypothetical protein MNEG_0968 [Monoraphidium neglectum]